METLQKYQYQLQLPGSFYDSLPLILILLDILQLFTFVWLSNNHNVPFAHFFKQTLHSFCLFI